MTSPVEAQEGQDDGRRARRDRNQEAVVAALLDCFAEGIIQPSAAELAERAGVSMRSLFRYFEDLDELGRIAIGMHIERYSPLFPLPSIGEGALADRIGRIVEQRQRLFEAIAPAARAAAMRAPTQPVIRQGMADRRRMHRRQVADHFAAELAVLPPERLDALDVLLSFDSWDLLRTNRRLSAARAADVLRDSVTALLRGGDD